MNRPPAKYVRWAAVTVAAAYGLLLQRAGINLPGGWIKLALAFLPLLLALLTMAADMWVLKVPRLGAHFGRPRLDGTWEATIRPRPDSHIPQGGNRGPIRAAVIIRQTYSTLHITTLTKESQSDSTSAALRKNNEDSDRFVMSYTYRNEPSSGHRGRSPIHYGAAHLNVGRAVPNCLEGSYWTDRLTAGSMTLKLLNRQTNAQKYTDVFAEP